MNVVGSRPDGWWRDRTAAASRLSSELERFARSRNERVVVVFDGRAPAPSAGPAASMARTALEEDRASSEGLVEVHFAPGGPDAADMALLAMLTGLAGRRDRVTLVSSDRALVSAALAIGVATIGAASFLAMLADALGAGPSTGPPHG